MAFTTTNKTGPIIATVIGLSLSAQCFAVGPGLNSRDQNPMLQAYYLPGMSIQQTNGWHHSHSLYITNTFQSETKGNEALTIDVENYRYDFALAYQSEDWRVTAVLPFIANRAGHLDDVIEDWHDFFGLPQGGRNTNPDDQIRMSYTRDGQTVFLQDKADDDIGDIALSFSYRLSVDNKNMTELSVGVELPTGSLESNSGNDATDFALWMSKSVQLSSDNRLYGLLGVALPGKGGQLQDYLVDQVLLAQLGIEYDFTNNITGIAQFDFHSAMIKNTELKAFGNSLQSQLALQFKNWFDEYHIDLFFSEDIVAKTAPDITFGLRVSHIGFN